MAFRKILGEECESIAEHEGSVMCVREPAHRHFCAFVYFFNARQNSKIHKIFFEKHCRSRKSHEQLNENIALVLTQPK